MSEQEQLSASRVMIQVSRPVHERLTAMKDQQQQQLKRQVSFTEIIEQLLEKAGAA